ncbi:MAG: hypothetical protein ACKVI4_10485 [Actinomycetales bacterium]
MTIAEILALVFIEDSPNGRSEALPIRMARQPMSSESGCQFRAAHLRRP